MPRLIKNKGIALLFSILMLSMVFTASLAIFQIVFTQLKLSESVRDSQLAYYAADSAVECALYVDLESGEFGQSGKPKVQDDCSGVNSNDIEKYQGSWVNGAVFTVNYDNGSCAKVTVNKTGSGGFKTFISALGFNVCEDTPRKFNRSLEVKY
ncbi:MAG: pilus assembly PilX N-terminal domain-containing protein [Patescibacteria group bacterium]